MMAQFAKNPSQKNWTGVKRYLRYFKETVDFALTYGGQGGGLETRAHPLCGCRWQNEPAPQIDQWLCVHNRRGSRFDSFEEPINHVCHVQTESCGLSRKSFALNHCHQQNL